MSLNCVQGSCQTHNCLHPYSRAHCFTQESSFIVLYNLKEIGFND